jgi:hypothetical protein
MGEHAEIRCATTGCSNVICMTFAAQARARETHEVFYCALGHHNHFPQETEQERRIRHLEAENKRLRRFWEEEEAENGDLRRGLHACRWVGCEYQGKSNSTWDFRDLWSHMRAAHGMPTLGAVRAAESEAESA